MTIIPIKNAQGDRTTLYLTCLILSIVGATFFSQIWDPDFFWHLATGRWIAQNISLPERDPFTPFFFGTDREAMILKGYWLAQVVYYFFYSLGGMAGVIFLKSFTFVGLFWLSLHYHQLKKTPYPWVFLALAPLYETLLHFRADRPNMLSLLFFAGLLYGLEKKRWQLLPLLMLIWANAHGGYLLGDVVILLYLGILALRKREELSPINIGCALLAVGASFINPLGLTPVLLMLKLEGSTYQQATFEFLSPVRIALEFHDYYVGYFVALLLATGVLLFCGKSAKWTHLATLLLTAFISLQHARYMPFFVITCAFFLPEICNKANLSLAYNRAISFSAIAMIAVLFLSDLADGRALTTGLAPERFPAKAADFVKNSNAPGNLFCNTAWGGYLIWRLPGTAVLSDSRALSENIYLKNLQIQNSTSSWEQELLTLNTTIIVVSAFDPITGKSNKLWKSLNSNPNWKLAYADDIALVFFRKDIADTGALINQRKALSASLNHALAQILTFVENYPQTPWHWGDLGQIHLLRGDIAEAVKAFRKAVELDPGNNDYRIRLKLLETR